MRLYRLLTHHCLVITIVLAVIGIGLMAFYTVCDTACSYLRGDIFGIDLKYVGVAYMAVITILALLKQADLIRMLVAAGIGVEVFLRLRTCRPLQIRPGIRIGLRQPARRTCSLWPKWQLQSLQTDNCG